MNSSITAERIRKYRKEKKWTQKQLGEACGIHEANIRKYELGTQNPKKETLEKIATALGVSLIDLGIITPDFKSAIEQFEVSGVKRFFSSASAEEIKINDYLDTLNTAGQQKVLAYTEDLTKIPEYQKKED